MGKGDSIDQLNLALLLLGRLSGFFVFSPLFSQKAIPNTVRLALAFGGSLLLFPPLSAIKSPAHFDYSFWFALQLIQEIAIGYIVGFIFSLLFEAAAFAGEVVGVLMGFSATELLNPLASFRSPLLSRFFLLTLFALFLTLDLHHAILRILYESFEWIPPGHYLIDEQVFSGVVLASNDLFHFALEFAFLPLILLVLLIAAFALLSRFIQIFWIGFPLQLLVGFIAIGLSIYYFIPTLQHAFLQLSKIVTNFIVNY